MGGPADPPADDPSGEGVDDEGHVDEALPGRDVGEVRQPERVRPRRWNCRFTRSSGQDAAGSLTVVRTSRPRTTPCRPIRRISRRDRATGDRRSLPPELPPHLAHAVDAEVRRRTRGGCRSPGRRRAGPVPEAGPGRRGGPHGRDTSTGRSAAPCRSARPRRPRDDRR